MALCVWGLLDIQAAVFTLSQSLCTPQAFRVLFHRAIEQADKVEDVQGRLSVLTESITHAVFVYTSQALFEKDKLTFLSQMAFQVSESVTQSIASTKVAHFCLLCTLFLLK